MEDKKLSLGSFEEIVLLVVARLRDKAYGVPIRQMAEDATRQTVSIGAVYTTLERLEQKGLVTSRQGEPTAERGGRAKRYYDITGTGVQALNDAERARTMLREGLELGLRPAGGVA
jgi:PadR family transcriptional regulator, regulatory protein PadR